GTCATSVGREPSDLPYHGDKWAHLMTGNTFPCDSKIESWEYYIDDNSLTSAYLTTWRPVAKSRFTLISSTRVVATRPGNHSVILTQQIDVKQGDFIGIHYEHKAKGGIIPFSRGNDDVVPDNQLFDTVILPRDDSDFHVGNTIDLSGWSTIKATFAVIARLEGYGKPIPTPAPTGSPPPINK
ncbi:unnamed protein product, partial [Owenia fusiformis]